MNRFSVVQALEQLLDFLEADASLLLQEQACDNYAAKVRFLLEKAKEPGEVLYVGILGGTGVGKSTLINALARENVSAPSDRRPYTDKAVLYRHRDAPGNTGKISGFIREPHALHSIDAVKDLVLLDLPDFDSKDEANRRAVLAVLPELDAVVWVASPEKYADAALYDMVKATAMHQENFVFVFNKADELVRNGSPDPHGHLKEVLGDLAFRLQHEAGLEQPRIYSLSSAIEFGGSAGDPVLGREFQRFRDFLMVRRDTKQIASMKAANLMEEVRRLEGEISADIRPRERIALVHSIRKSYMPTQGEGETVSPLLLPDAEKDLAAAIAGVLASPDPSIWPVRWAVRLLSPVRSAASPVSRRNVDGAFTAAAEGLAKDLRLDLNKTAARIGSELLLAFQTTRAFGEIGEPGLLLERTIRQGSIKLAQELQARANRSQGPTARLLRAWQHLVLSVPVLILVVKLAGPERIQGWLSAPSLAGCLSLILASLTSLFGPEGLIGLSVLAICELVLTFVLAARRAKGIGRTAQRLARSTLEELDAGLNSVARTIRESGDRALTSIEDALQKLVALEAVLGSPVAEKAAGTDTPLT